MWKNSSYTMALMNFKLHKKSSSDPFQLVSTMLQHFVILALFVHVNMGQYCNRDSGVTWHTNLEIINISWSVDNVCNSYEDCYGSTGTGISGPIDHQLCPVEIQDNDRLVILPPSISSGSVLPVNVSEDEFYSCPSDIHPFSQWLVPAASTAPFEVDKAFLQEGRNFFAQFPNGDVFLRCELGLRVVVSVKSHDCTKNQSEPFCTGHGECTTRSPVAGLFSLFR